MNIIVKMDMKKGYLPLNLDFAIINFSLKLLGKPLM